MRFGKGGWYFKVHGGGEGGAAKAEADDAAEGGVGKEVGFAGADAFEERSWLALGEECDEVAEEFVHLFVLLS